MKVIIFYKNYSYKIIKLKKFSYANIKKDYDKIRMIMVPLEENENAFIQIKPSTFYDFARVEVNIEYNCINLDPDFDGSISNYITSFPHNEYKRNCKSIVEFINAIYNVCKFIELSDFIDNCTNHYPISVSWYIMPIRVRCIAYDSMDRKIDEIDTGVSKEFDKKTALDILDHTLTIQEIVNERCKVLHEFIDQYPKYPFVYLQSSKEYKPTNHYSDKESQYAPLLYGLPGLSVFYLASNQFYDLCAKHNFQVNIVDISKNMTPDNVYSKLLKSPTEYTSVDENVIRDFLECGTYEPMIEFYSEVSGLYNLGPFLIYTKTMMNYVRFFYYYLYEGEPEEDEYTTMECVLMIYDGNGNCKLFPERALDRNNLIKAFSYGLRAW